MKKLTYSLAVVVSIAVISVSCKKSHPVDCTASLNKVSAAAQAYGSSGSSADCKAYKVAVQDYLNSSCANSASAQDKADMQAAIDGLSCP